MGATQYHSIFRFALSTFLIVFSIVVVGCTSGKRYPVGEQPPTAQTKEIRGEAYLFDAKVHRKDKWNSFRLEIYQSDSVLGLGGRGYLGKGVLKGRLTTDTLKVYFPSADEYVLEPVTELLESQECLITVPPFSIVALFRNLPDSADLDSSITVQSDYENSDRPTFKISLPGCPWLLEVTYDYHSTGWRIREFMFEDGHGNDLVARRREYREDTGLSPEKFTVAIPPGAVRIIP